MIASGSEFEPVFIFVVIGLLVAIGMLTVSAVLGPRKTTAVKQMPYESGMDPIGDARNRFDVRYYLVAIVFLLFDVELLYLYPWAVSHWSASTATSTIDSDDSAATTSAAEPAFPPPGIPPTLRKVVLFDVLVFIAVLAAAFAYAWRKGVFEWR